MKTETAFDEIKTILLTHGVIDNYACWDKRITNRLGGYIHVLRRDGWNIETKRGWELPKWTQKNKKNTYYFLKK